MILLSHPTGNPNVRQSLQALYEAGRLAEFWVTLNLEVGQSLQRFIPGSIRDEMGRRQFTGIPRQLINTVPCREALRVLAGRLGLDATLCAEGKPLHILKISAGFDRRVASRLRHVRGLQAVYGYEDAALHTFAEAQRLGLRRIYELPTPHWRTVREILADERELQPEWKHTLPIQDVGGDKYAQRDQELQMADVVIAASRFTERSLVPLALGKPVALLAYGAPTVRAEKLWHNFKEPLRVLYVGNLAQHKGLAYLLDAMQDLGKRGELTLVGSRMPVPCKPLDAALKKHRWIPAMPHNKLLEEMGRHDVLVLPSLFEGFGLVILEAMAQGLPVIATPHTGGPDVITDGEEGFIVPIRSASAIAEKLLCLAEDRALLRQMSVNAQNKAKDLGWENYRRCLVAAIEKHIAQL